jgi:hypothetical protein
MEGIRAGEARDGLDMSRGSEPRERGVLLHEYATMLLSIVVAAENMD